MKILFLVSVMLCLLFPAAALGVPSDRFSLKDFKSALKADSSDAKNAELAREVLKEGVSFEYTARREKDLREWGANDELIAAIWQSIVDESDEGRLFKEFMKNYDSDNKEVRKASYQKGKLYLTRFESNERFGENVNRVKKEIRFLACEFDPELGC